MTKNSGFQAFWLGLMIWVGVFILSLKMGAVSDPSMDLLMQVRLPRVVLASFVGMGLAVSGAALQALFANPLCEPYTLGICSGSALGSVIGVSLGLEWVASGLASSAFIGAMVFAAILYLVSMRPGSTNVTVLLTGVMLGFLGTSLVALWMAFSDSNGLQSVISWLFGDLSRARLKGTLISGIGVFTLTLLIWAQWRPLDAMLMGEQEAEALGIHMPSVRARMIILTSSLIGICVSSAGMIGFVGLVIPHFARKIAGSLHFRLIPVCAIWGAVALTLADCLSRILLNPFELPVGVVTALVGAPVFLWIMLQRREAL